MFDQSRAGHLDLFGIALQECVVESVDRLQQFSASRSPRNLGPANPGDAVMLVRLKAPEGAKDRATLLDGDDGVDPVTHRSHGRQRHSLAHGLRPWARFGLGSGGLEALSSLAAYPW
jgi:hypothetical protein